MLKYNFVKIKLVNTLIFDTSIYIFLLNDIPLKMVDNLVLEGNPKEHYFWKVWGSLSHQFRGKNWEKIRRTDGKQFGSTEKKPKYLAMVFWTKQKSN